MFGLKEGDGVNLRRDCRLILCVKAALKTDSLSQAPVGSGKKKKLRCERMIIRWRDLGEKASPPPSLFSFFRTRNVFGAAPQFLKATDRLQKGLDTP